MRKNRRVNKKMSVNVAIATHFGVLILTAFCMAIVNYLAYSNSQQLQKRIGVQERELARLEDAYNRETSRWAEMKTPERVERALLKHGLAMKPPRPEQNVKMKEGGTPYPHQLSVTMAQKRAQQQTGRFAKGR